MSPTSAISQYGAALSIGGTTVAQLDEIGEVKITNKLVDATGHDSSSGWDELIPSGRKSASAIPIKGRLKVGDTNGQIALKTALLAGTLSSIVITFPTAITATWSFSAYVEDFSTGALGEAGDAVEFTATLRVSGTPTLAITASGDLTTLTGIEENTGAALTFTPTFDGAKYVYNVAVNTASTWVKFTPTLAGATITISNGTTSQDVASGAQSGTIAITDGAVTTVTLSVKETGKVAKVYTVHIYTP